MSNLQTKLDAILADKNANLLPENLKKGVTLLGITGTLEQGSGGGVIEGMRQFASIDEMNADTSAVIGDISVVYGLAGDPLAIGSTFRKITFPETVNCTVSSTIDFTSWLQPVDDAHMLDMMSARLTATQFVLQAYTDMGDIRVRYTGSDGVYTRNTFSASGDAVIDGNTLDFGMDIQVVTNWNEVLNNFFSAEVMSFGGIYEKKTVADESKIYLKAISDEQYINTYIDRQKLVDMANIVLADLGWSTFKYFLNNNDEVCAIYCPENPYYVGIVQKDGLLDNPAEDYLGITGQYNSETSRVTRTLIVYKLDLDAKTYSLVGQYSTTSYIQRDSGNYHTYTTDIDIKSIIGSLDVLGGVIDNSRVPTTCGTAWKYGASSISFDPFQATLDVWKPASTQLDTTADGVYQKTFYGVNGVEKGTLQDGTGLTAEQLRIKVDIWNSISELETTDLDLTFCLENYTGTAIPKIDTSKVVNAGYMFSNCTALETVPELDMSNATNVYNIFNGCSALSNESLNNILAMCVTATKYIAAGNNVTLKGLGLTSAQATTCTSLSIWSAASAAGWTTGY